MCKLYALGFWHLYWHPILPSSLFNPLQDNDVRIFIAMVGQDDARDLMCHVCTAVMVTTLHCVKQYSDKPVVDLVHVCTWIFFQNFSYLHAYSYEIQPFGIRQRSLPVKMEQRNCWGNIRVAASTDYFQAWLSVVKSWLDPKETKQFVCTWYFMS